MDDKQIIELYFARDESAVARTQEKYGSLCFAVADRILENTEDSKECVNEALMQTWSSIPPARPQNLKGYLCRITQNSALMRVRYDNSLKRSAELTVSFEELEELFPDSCFSSSDNTDNIELSELLEDFLRKQRPIVRKVFLMKYFYFFTQKQIAQRCSFSEHKVNSMLRRTRNKLREYLSKEGYKL